MRGGTPVIRIAPMVTACSEDVDTAIGDAEQLGASLVVRELIFFLRDCVQGFEAFYTRLTGLVAEGSDVCRCG